MTKSGFDIDELERLLAAATPGEWRNHASGLDDYSYAISSHDKVTCFTDIVADLVPLDEAETNAALIVAARNSLPAMIAEIRELRAENARLRDLLRRNIDDEPCWRDHHGYCQAHYLEEDCSVDAARAALGEPR